MALYAIGDLHLSFSTDKPMDIFGDIWVNHTEKIKNNWAKKITQEDTVLIPGDISWGMKLAEAMEDLKWIDSLPGRKVLLRGNHDYWWGSIKKLNNIFESMSFLQNNYYPYKDYAICGTRGWICPNEAKFDEHDEKIYRREILRLKLSLDSAIKDGYKKIIVMTHYPPTNDKLEPSEFTKTYEEYKVEKVIYGHLHDKSYDLGLKGVYNSIEYHLVSADYLNFDPKIILE